MAVPTLVADRGIRTSTATGTAVVSLTSGADIKIGALLIARVSVDNSGTSGALPGLAVTDTAGNTWTVGAGALNDPGAASAGIAAYLCYVVVAKPYTNSSTVTFTWTTGTPRSAIVIEEWSGIDPSTPVAVAQTTGSGASTSVSVAKTPTVIGQLVYAMGAIQNFSSVWGAADADGTQGTWIDLTKDEANTGTASTSASVYGNYKIVTGTGAQTWNNTLTGSSSWAAVAIAFAIGAQTPLWATAGTPTVAEDPPPGVFQGATF